MGRSAGWCDRVVRCRVLRANVCGAEPSRTGCYCSRFRSAILCCSVFSSASILTAINCESIFRHYGVRVAIFCRAARSSAAERGVTVFVCCACLCGFGGFFRFHAGNEYADFAGSFGIARQFGADSRGGA
jgi:hypothetical protein